LGAELEEKRLFAKPRLALDGVGGISAVRLAETLHQGCPLIVYACASGRAATFPWHHWVGKGLIVRGFSLRNWMKENKKKTPKMMETLAKLVNANKIAVEYTEYELSTEFDEALEHACEKHRKTKILLKITDIGSTVDENDK
jgi:mitochondrial enoyl-[acyl-carrier protein] reductase / trans-2-enoyl-CoA reductase